MIPLEQLKNGTGASRPGLALLIKLRWLALCGQIVLCAFSALVLHMHLPWEVLGLCLLLTAVTNIVAMFAGRRMGISGNAVCSALLLLDTLTLTVMLFWTGGSHNPFAIFYLMHIAIAAVLLPSAMAWVMVVWAGACYAVLFASPHSLHAISANEFCGSIDFHLQGMLLSMVLVGIGIVYFTGRLRVLLARSETELVAARAREVRNERFGALATLAAGVAHEMATPLSTIAIVSEEMEQQAGGGCGNSGCLKDARLIRSQVQRCHAILEKLREQTTEGTGDPYEEILLSELPALLEPYLEPAHWRRIRFSSRYNGQTARVPQTALLQSLAVLVKNACQASAPEEPVGICAQGAAGGICFVVEDKGRGIPADVLTRLGEPFVTTRDPGSGMGLGLFLVRMFVERINGDLRIESSESEGTRIFLTIPQPKARQ